MNLRILWSLLNLIGFFCTLTVFFFDLKDAIRIYYNGKNGLQRRTANRRVINSFCFFSIIIAFSILSTDAFLSPHQVGDRGVLFAFGVSMLLLVNVNVIIASFYSLSQRVEDFEIAQKYDTDGKKYDTDGKKKSKTSRTKTPVRMLGIWPVSFMLDMQRDYDAVRREIGAWELHAIYSENITIEKLIRDTAGKEFEIIYVAAHCDGENIDFGDDYYVSILEFSDFVATKKPKLIILNVCLGDAFANLMLDQGAEAVVYWLEPVVDEDAIKVTSHLFNNLSLGIPVHESARQAALILPSHVALPSLRVAGNRKLIL